MKKALFTLIFCAGAAASQAQNITLISQPDPKPVVVTPAAVERPVPPPSDAYILFDGTNFSEWQHKDGSPVKWELSDGAMTVVPQTGEIRTKRDFEDYQLHLEWASPAEVKGQDQLRGNSGVFMQCRYEIQILDSYQNDTYVNGQAGSVYKQYPPLVNAMQKPGEWNTYDIIYTAPRFKENGQVISLGRITVLHNGVLVQNNSLILGATNHAEAPTYTPHGPAPIMLQDHGDLVKFRNIWIREL